MTRDDITSLFAADPTNIDYRRTHARESIRSLCRTLAGHILDTVHPGEERDEAIKRLREVMHWSHAAIARHADPDERV